MKMCTTNIEQEKNNKTNKHDSFVFLFFVFKFFGIGWFEKTKNRFLDSFFLI